MFYGMLPRWMTLARCSACARLAPPVALVSSWLPTSTVCTGKCTLAFTSSVTHFVEMMSACNPLITPDDLQK